MGTRLDEHVGLYGFDQQPRRRAFRLTGFAYGASAALILDEFALWLNLKDVYWQKQGRESLEALALFGGFLLWALLIAPFARAVWRHLRGRSATVRVNGKSDSSSRPGDS